MHRRLLITAIPVTVALGVGAAVAVTATSDEGLHAGNIVFLTLLFGLLIWALGAAVVSAHAAVRARSRATAAARRSLDDVIGPALEEERARMSADIEAMVRRSVTRIDQLVTRVGAVARRSGAARTRESAVATDVGEANSAPAVLRQIQHEGRRTASELRRLIGLLRAPASGPASSHRASEAPRGIRVVDLAIAAVVTSVAVAEYVLGGIDGLAPNVAQGALTALAAAAVVLSRANPGLAGTMQALVVVIGLVVAEPVASGLWMVVAFGLTVWSAVARPSRGALGVVGPVALVAAVLTSQWLHFGDNTFIIMVVLLTAGATGLMSRIGERRRRRENDRAARRDADLAGAVIEAVRRDRTSMARELHDAISGTIGVIVLQAGAAELLWDVDRAKALAAVSVIEASVEEAQRDLADLLQSLPGTELATASGGTEPALPVGSATRGLADLPDLAERIRRAGLDVMTTLPDRSADIAPDIATTAYRIAQECLANAARHAPGSRVLLRVTRTPTELILEVEDDGPGSARPPRTGYGLLGLAERVGELGGDLSMGPGDGGTGFHVTAHLPLTALLEATP